jgi:hypothetical protein
MDTESSTWYSVSVQTNKKPKKKGVHMRNDKPYEIKVQPLENYKPVPWHVCTYYDQGTEYVKMTYMKNRVETHVRRIDAEHYEVISTGEVKKYSPTTDKAKRQAKRAALNRTFDELRGILRMNFVSKEEQGTHKQVSITLTYRVPVFDTGKVFKDFRQFMRRLERAYSDSEFAWVAVVEPHGSGAWHIHLMLKHLNRGALWIDKEDLTRIWGHGGTEIERIKASDAGAYYVAYFTSVLDDASNDGVHEDMTGEELLEYERECAEAVFDSKRGLARNPSKAMSAARKKGARLHHYPKHFKLYRCSQNIERPIKESGFVFELEDDLVFKEIHSSAFQIVKVYEDAEIEPEVLNEICHRTYRKHQADQKD